MAFDYGSLSQAGFNHVRIDGSLREEIHFPNFSCRLFKGTDKLFSDYFPLLLRISDTGQTGEEALLCIDAHKTEFLAGEGFFHLITFLITHQSMVDEHTGQSVSDSF